MDKKETTWLIWPHIKNHQKSIMFILLAALGLAHAVDIIDELNDYTFDKYVKHRKNTSTIFVMFYKNNSPECKKAALAFVEAAESSYGMVQFARANVRNNTHVVNDLKITSYPTFMIFYPGGTRIYDQKEITAKNLVRFSDRFIPRLAEPVDEYWVPGKEGYEVDSAAILFSQKKYSPTMWNAISNAYNETYIRIGFCNNENITKEFNVTDVPAIGFLHNKTFTLYNGNKTFLDIFYAIKKEYPELARPRPPPTPKPKPSDYVTDEGVWKATCKKKKYCILQAKSNKTEDFIKFAEDYVTEPFKFVSCGETCPFPEMTDGFWVFHTKLDRAMYAEDLEGLKLHLGRFLGGNPKWTNREELLAEVKAMKGNKTTTENVQTKSESSQEL